MNEEENLFTNEETTTPEQPLSKEKPSDEIVKTDYKQPLEAPDFDPDALDDQAPSEKGVRMVLADEEYGKKGITGTIKKVWITKARTKDNEGNIIPPEESDSGAKYYKVKLAVLYEIPKKTEKMVEYYPGITYFINDGQFSKPAIQRIEVSQIEEKEDHQYTPTTAKIFAKFARHLNKQSSEISDKDFIKGLPGKKVKFKKYVWEYKDRSGVRNDILTFV